MRRRRGFSNGYTMTAQPQFTIAPTECAKWTLEFLEATAIMGREHDRFAMCRAMLRGIAAGTLIVSPAAAPPKEEPAAPAKLEAPEAPRINGKESRSHKRRST